MYECAHARTHAHTTNHSRKPNKIILFHMFSVIFMGFYHLFLLFALRLDGFVGWYQSHGRIFTWPSNKRRSEQTNEYKKTTTKIKREKPSE